MKKTALIFIALSSIILLAWNAQAKNNENAPVFHFETNMPHGYEKIELQGDLATLVGPNAIEAGASDDAVYIGFNEDLGNVNITIYNGMGGVVYSTVVNSGVQSVVIIPFSGVASGSYIVELNNANGYAEGDFEHD